MQAFLKTGKSSNTIGDKALPSTSSGAHSGERRKPPTPWVEK